MADLAASLPELAKISAVHVRPAFKDELAIVIDDHGKAVTVEAIVL
jgi:hypothetical protein